jgi:hypothetical protein
VGAKPGKGDRESREGDGSCHRCEDNLAVCAMCAGENLLSEFAPISSRHSSHSSSLLLTEGGCLVAGSAPLGSGASPWAGCLGMLIRVVWVAK